MSPKSESGFWLNIAGAQATAIARSIDERNAFSMTVVTAETKPKRAELVVVCFSVEDEDFVPEELEGTSLLHFGISQSGRRVATGESTIAVSNLVSIPSLNTTELRALLPKKFQSSFNPPMSGAYRPSPRLWRNY